MNALVARSQEIIATNQAPSRSYPACPDYPAYRYCWFRDDTFIAGAMDRWGEHGPIRGRLGRRAAKPCVY
jgi:GH15 family glucan-1,4-alpha-glucosidase